MEFIVFVMCLPIFIPLWIIYIIFMCNYKPKRGRKRNYYNYESHHYDDYEDDIHDTGEIFNRFQDGTCSKSDMELLMEDDDIRDEFYEDY